MFRGDLNNTGYSDSTVPDTNKTFFEFIADTGIYSSAIYYDFKIYFGSFSGKLYAVDVATGSEIWNNTTSNSIRATPLIVGDTLYVGSKDSNFYAFNATTGEQLWESQIEGQIESSAKYYKGMVFFGTYGLFNLSSGSFDGKLYALNATTGTEVWNFTTGDQIWSSPAISNESIFFGSLDGNVYCLWTSNGTKKWNYTTGTPAEQVYSSPAVYNGKVFVGTRFQATQEGALLSLDENTGALNYIFDTDGFVYSSPAVHNGTVFFGTAEEPWLGDGYVYALPVDDPDGNGVVEQHEIIWRAVSKDDHEGGSSPVVAGGMVLVGSNGANKLLCLNETTGEHIWNLSIDSGIVASPLVIDGKVFIGSLNSVMYAIGASGLPLLDIQILPESLTVKSARTLRISFLVTHAGQPIQGAFINVAVTNGTLTQSGFSTFSDGTQKVKFIAPVVEENRTITITADATKYGFEDALASLDFIVEPAETYEDETEEDFWAEFVKYLPYTIVIIVLVVLNIFVFIIIRRKKTEAKDKEGK